MATAGNGSGRDAGIGRRDFLKGMGSAAVAAVGAGLAFTDHVRAPACR